MKSLLRTAAFASLAVAVTCLYLLSPAVTEKAAEVLPADELEYPVLLVHGLGEGPGEDAFGKLEEYLEKYYFDVEVMDFNKYRNKASLVNHKNQDYLGVMAAVLGTEIRDILEKYNTDKLHIVAHSFGGVIVQAYLLNYGEEFAKKTGGYDNNVARVCYIQTPFYGSTADPAVIKDLVDDTDYGAYSNKTAITNILEPGNDWLFDMDEKLRVNNIYRYREDWNFIDAATLVSRADEIVDVPFGLLSAFLRKDETTTFHHYSIFDGKYGKYSHSTHPSSAVDKLNSLAYVENLDDPNFMAIASFLDNGRNWRKIGFKNLTDNGIVMVKYEKKPGYKDVQLTDVTLLLKKKFKSGESADAPARSDITADYYNENSQTFVFSGLISGTYTIKVKNPKQKTLEEEIEVDPVDLNSYAYDPKEHKLYEGGERFTPPSKALLFRELLVYTKKENQEETWYPLPGLNTNGFAIEFDSQYGDMSDTDKGVIFALYNISGRTDDYRWNGGRFEFNYRGNKYGTAPGCITFYMVADANHDGAYHREQMGYEIIEVKSIRLFDWYQKHHVKIAQWTDGGVRSRVDIWVDGENVTPWRDNSGEHPYIYETAPYYNPDPIISFGGRYHSNYYGNPTGMTLSNITVYNLDQD